MSASDNAPFGVDFNGVMFYAREALRAGKPLAAAHFLDALKDMMQTEQIPARAEICLAELDGLRKLRRLIEENASLGTILDHVRNIPRPPPKAPPRHI